MEQHQTQPEQTVVVDIDGGRRDVDPPKLTYNQQPIKVFQATESCRHLGFGATTDGNMTVTKHRVLAKTKEVLGLLTHHPLETKTAKELFQSMVVSVFRFSTAQVRWSQQSSTNFSRYGFKPTIELNPSSTAQPMMFSFSRKNGGVRNYPPLSTSLRKNFATISPGV